MALNRTEIVVAKFDRATKFCCGRFEFGICTFSNSGSVVTKGSLLMYAWASVGGAYVDACLFTQTCHEW